VFWFLPTLFLLLLKDRGITLKRRYKLGQMFKAAVFYLIAAAWKML